MSTGRHGRTVDQSEIIQVVTELAAAGKNVPGGGVTVEAVAEELDFECSTLVPYCRELAKSNELERTWGIGPSGPKMTYSPVDGKISK